MHLHRPQEVAGVQEVVGSCGEKDEDCSLSDQVMGLAEPELVSTETTVLLREAIKKTSRESRKAALRISHLLSRCQVVFTKICHYYYCPYCYCRYCHYY